MNAQDTRQQVVSQLRTLESQTTDAEGSLHGATYRTKQTRLSAPTVNDLYELLTDHSGWGMSADKMRDRMRISVLDVNDYNDEFDGRPFRKDELEMLVEKLEGTETASN